MRYMGKKFLYKFVWMMGIPVLVISLLHPCTVLAKASVFRGGDIAHKDLAELAIGGGMTEMLRETRKTVKYTVFSTTNYGNTKMNTIADTEVTGYGEVIGAGRRFLIGKGKMFFGGIYYERSRSESDSWTNNGKTKGKGIQNGGGIMGRLDVKSGNFYEWLLHIGRANNRVNSAALKYEADPSYIGGIGEYLKLEVISIIRNKNVKKQFWSGTFASIMLCSVFAFTDVYDDSPFMRCFICEYCFSCLAVVLLTGVMGVEGNYIDGLMSRKESILNLLKHYIT